jgi:mannosyltransferase
VSPSPRGPASVLAAVAALTAGAFALRTAGLGRLPLWLDEGFSYLQIMHRPLADWRLDVHPPLYYAVLWAWAQVSTSDVWLRALSALIGASTVPVVYALGARLFGRAAGLWAAGFLAVAWMHTWHSREARMYPLLVLAFALALWGLVAGARDERALGWAVYAIAAAAMAWTHAVGVYYAAIVAGLALAIPRPDGARRLDARWLAATAGVALLFAPWVPVALARTRDTARLYWVTKLDSEPPIFTTLHALTVAPIPSPARRLQALLGLDLGPLGAALLGAWIWLLPLLAALALAIACTEPSRRWAVGLLVAAYVAPLGLFTAMSLAVRPILIPRIALPVVVPLVLLLAAGVQAVPWRRARPVAGLAIGLVLLLGTLQGLQEAATMSDGWGEASRHVAAAAGPGDVLLFVVTPTETLPGSAAARALSTHEMLLLRYDPTGRLAALPRVATHRAEQDCAGAVAPCLDAALQAAGAVPGTRLWVIRRKMRELPAPLARWAQLRLEPGSAEQFQRIFVEPLRVRP